MSDLVERLGSDDFNERAKALAALVGQGSSATPSLTAALQDGDDLVRVQAARALAEIGDPAAADTFAAALDDDNPEVRGHAAVGLARIGDPRALDALVRTIDDLPDILHHPYSASVYALIELGTPALEAVEPLLSAEDPTTRERAFAVARSVISSLDEPDATHWSEWLREHS